MTSAYEADKPDSEGKESDMEDAALETGDLATNRVKEGEEYFVTGSKLAVLITGLCLALFLIGLDTAIVSTVCNLERQEK
jgi:hypothetical protein